MAADVIPRVYGSAVEEIIYNFILLEYFFSLSKFILFSNPCNNFWGLHTRANCLLSLMDKSWLIPKGEYILES